MLKKIKALLSGQGDLKEIITKSSIAMILRVLGMAINYLFLTFVIFKYGSGGWGTFAICFSILQFSSMVGTLGMDMAIVKLYASNNNYNKSELFRYVISYALPINIILVLLIYLNADFIGSYFQDIEDVGSYIRFTSLGIIPFSFTLIIAGAFRGLKKIATYTSFDSLGRFVAGLLFVLILSTFMEEDKAVIIGFVIGLYVLLVVELFFLFKILRQFKKDEEHKENIQYSSIEMLKFALSLFWNPIANRGIGWVTIFILGYYVSKSDIGIYDTCYRLGSLLFIIQFAINSISAPKFAEFSNQEEKSSLNNIVRYTTKLIFFIVTPLFVLLGFGGWWILGFFGEEFSEHYLVFVFILVGQYIGSLSSPVGLFMQMTGFHIAYRNILIIVLIVNSILGMTLIPKYGIEGGALVIGLTLALKNIMGVIYVYHKTRIRILYLPFLK